MKNTELDKKIAGSIKLLQSVQKAHEGEEIELAYSGGKDSDVILQLAKEAGINYRAILTGHCDINRLIFAQCNNFDNYMKKQHSPV